MDEKDFAVLRAMGRGRELFIFGARDPRLDAREIARRAGVGERTLRRRLAGWTRSGFLVRYKAIPNPRLYGLRLFASGIRTRDALTKRAVLEAFARLPGAFATIEHLGEWTGIVHASVGPPHMPTIPGVDAIQPFFEIALPSPLPLRGIDRRLMELLAEGHELSASARALRVSLRTATRSYARLREAHVLFAQPELDFARYEGAVVGRLVVTLSEADAARETLRRLRALSPCFAHRNAPGEGPYEVPDGVLLDVFCHLPNAAAAQRLEVAAAGTPGVEGVEVLFPVRLALHEGWRHPSAQAAKA